MVIKNTQLHLVLIIDIYIICSYLGIFGILYSIRLLEFSLYLLHNHIKRIIFIDRCSIFNKIHITWPYLVGTRHITKIIKKTRCLLAQTINSVCITLFTDPFTCGVHMRKHQRTGFLFPNLWLKQRTAHVLLYLHFRKEALHMNSHFVADSITCENLQAKEN